MRLSLVCAATILAASATAQINYYVPVTANPAVGTCNVIPFGSNSTATWGDQKYQTKAAAADLGNMVGIITGLGFAPCGTGSIHFDSLEIIIDHHPAGTPMNTTFASNLTANAVTVLSATDYTWNITANTWNEVGLQNLFVYNGVDDIVIQISQLNAVTTGSIGFHRDVQPRLFSTSGSTATTGTLATGALIWEVSELTARLSTYGVGCAGTNGTPVHTLSGSAQPGNSVGLDLSNAAPNGFAVVALGFYNGNPPFPLDLAALGAAGCFQYHDIVAAQFVLCDPTGSATSTFNVPAGGNFIGTRIFSQYGCIDLGANALGVTTSNYGRIFIGS